MLCLVINGTNPIIITQLDGGFGDSGLAFRRKLIILCFQSILVFRPKGIVTLGKGEQIFHIVDTVCLQI